MRNIKIIGFFFFPFLCSVIFLIPHFVSAEIITLTPNSIITGEELNAVATTSDGGTGGNGNGYRSACLFNPNGSTYTASNCGSDTASRNSDMNWTGGANSLGLPVNLPANSGYFMVMSDDNISGMTTNCGNVSYNTCVNVGYGYVATGTFDIVNDTPTTPADSAQAVLEYLFLIGIFLVFVVGFLIARNLLI